MDYVRIQKLWDKRVSWMDVVLSSVAILGISVMSIYGLLYLVMEWIVNLTFV